jgi:hypothetical protein
MKIIYNASFGNLCLLNAHITIHKKDDFDDIYVITAIFTPSKINFLPKIQVMYEIIEYKKKMSNEDELGLITYTYKIKLKAKQNTLPEELFVLIEKTNNFNICFSKLNKKLLTNNLDELNKMKIVVHSIGK